MQNYLLAVLVCFFFGGTIFYLWFHRLPVRTTSFGSNTIISPADGVIWQILSLDSKDNQGTLEIPKQFLGKILTFSNDVEKAATVVSIFMSPLDVHVNWSPVNGKILYSRHSAGSFSFAKSWRSFSNEKNEILFDTGTFQVKMIQIAGFLARRIEFWASAGDQTVQGEPIGMIRFGSQVSLILPGNISLGVKKGQRVKGGETILGTCSI